MGWEQKNGTLGIKCDICGDMIIADASKPCDFVNIKLQSKREGRSAENYDLCDKQECRAKFPLDELSLTFRHVSFTRVDWEGFSRHTVTEGEAAK